VLRPRGFAPLAGYEAVRRPADPQPVDHLRAVAAAGVADLVVDGDIRTGLRK
jgi:hypothetical protein